MPSSCNTLSDFVDHINFLRTRFYSTFASSLLCLYFILILIAAKALAESQQYGPRTRHIAVRHHYIRLLVTRKEIIILHIPSKYQLADGFTKIQPKILALEHEDALMGRGIPQIQFADRAETLFSNTF